MLATKGKGGKADKISTKYSTPVLVLEDGTCICDSTAIARYICQRFSSSNGSINKISNNQINNIKNNLYSLPQLQVQQQQQVQPLPVPGFNVKAMEPEAIIIHLEKRFHDSLGPHARRMAYYYILQDVQLTYKVAKRNVWKYEAYLWYAMFPLLRRQIKKGLVVKAERVEKSMQAVRREFAYVEETLKDGRKFLLGSEFSMADLTFAALAAPVLLPSPAEGYGAVLPLPQQVHERFRAFVNEMRESKAGQFALRMYRENRGTRVIPGTPLIASKL